MQKIGSCLHTHTHARAHARTHARTRARAFLIRKDITEKPMTIKPSTFNTHNSEKYLFCPGGRSTFVMPQAMEPYIRKGDVIGCALDLTVPVITFTFNGHLVKGSFRNFNLDGMFFPVISCSSKLRYSSWLWIEHYAVNNLSEKVQRVRSCGYFVCCHLS
jgi:hypothetical protein